MHVKARVFTLGLLGLFMHKMGLENQFWIHVAWIYRLFFKLIVFLIWYLILDFDTLMFFFFVSFLVQVYLCMILWLVWIKRVCFKSQKCLFLGLAEIALVRNFSEFLGNVLRVLRKNIVLALRIGPILVHFFAYNPSLCIINQFNCINNMILTFFNPRVSV